MSVFPAQHVLAVWSETFHNEDCGDLVSQLKSDHEELVDERPRVRMQMTMKSVCNHVGEHSSLKSSTI